MHIAGLHETFCHKIRYDQSERKMEALAGCDELAKRASKLSKRLPKGLRCVGNLQFCAFPPQMIIDPRFQLSRCRHRCGHRFTIEKANYACVGTNFSKDIVEHQRFWLNLDSLEPIGVCQNELVSLERIELAKKERRNSKAIAAGHNGSKGKIAYQISKRRHSC